jgi:hypothetical protein
MTRREADTHAVHAELREFEEFKELVKRMREAQKEWEADLANGDDEDWGKSWEKDRLEREVDECLKKQCRN